MATETRLAHLCWLGAGSGLGFYFDEERSVRKKSKIDDQITKARHAEASWLNTFMEDGQTSLNNRARDIIQECKMLKQYGCINS